MTRCKHFAGSLYCFGMGDTTRRQRRNIAGAFMLAYSMVAFTCFLILDETWAHSAPARPDYRRGLVYAHNEHGWITYFSAFQATSCALLFGTMLLLGIAGIAILPKRNIKTGRACLWARWDWDDPCGGQRIGTLYGLFAAVFFLFAAGPLLVDGLNRAGVVLTFG